MVKEGGSFWPAVILGFAVMILLAMLTVNTLGLIPVLGPLLGGIVAGFFAGKDFVYGAKAGLAAGIFGMVAVLIDFILRTGFLQAAIPTLFVAAGVFLLLLAMVVYFPILAYIGGAIGGAVRRVAWKEKKNG